MTATFFSVHDIVCSRNNQVLFPSVNFALTEGQILHIRGENGVGKTTLLRALAGLSAPCEGTIHWMGENITENEDYKHQLHFLGHKNAIKSALTVEENLSLSFTYPKIASEKLHLILRIMGLASKYKLLAGALSSGQKRRLAISTLLISAAKIWILDEPFTSLDQEGVNLMQDLMLEHLAGKGIIIFTSHHALTKKFAAYQQILLRSTFA